MNLVPSMLKLIDKWQKMAVVKVFYIQKCLKGACRKIEFKIWIVFDSILLEVLRSFLLTFLEASESSFIHKIQLKASSEKKVELRITPYNWIMEHMEIN